MFHCYDARWLFLGKGDLQQLQKCDRTLSVAQELKMRSRLLGCGMRSALRSSCFAIAFVGVESAIALVGMRSAIAFVGVGNAIADKVY